ncbi:MAG: hypothetical protein IPF73_17440 [Betaproteobacteria bacterium]|nr:hypothetical protein [Betaproteobacteria bacterium]
MPDQGCETRLPVTNQALPGGYQLLNYRIVSRSAGGFSIVYRAFDDAGQPVAIKEYLPASLVLRTEEATSCARPLAKT